MSQHLLSVVLPAKEAATDGVLDAAAQGRKQRGYAWPSGNQNGVKINAVHHAAMGSETKP